MRKLTRKIAKILFALILIFILICSCCFLYYYVKINNAYSHIKFDKEKLISATSFTELYDESNDLIGQTSLNGRSTILLEDIPKHTKYAFIAVEDKDFYHHHGINYKRIFKSFLVNFKNGYAKQGASTISQQLIKNTHLNNEKTIERKLKEFFLTKKLENTFSKDEILETYLNVIYFGNGCFGIEDASNFYFNKKASDLNIAESACLAGIIKSPKLYSPTENMENCLNRRNLVLKLMKENDFISQSDYDKSIKQKIDLKNLNQSNYLEKNILRNVTEHIGLDEFDIVKNNLKVSTFIDKELQNFIDKIDLTSLLQYDDKMPEHAILVKNNLSGGIIALRTSSQVDIKNTLRQPASCLKPFLVYAPALEKGMNLLTKIDDVPTKFHDFEPHNAGGKYNGKISLKDSLSLSSNVCATKILNEIGLSYSKNIAQKFGFTFTKKDNHLALALGSINNGCNLTTLLDAYSALANGGEYTESSLIKEIKGKNNLTLYNFKNTKKSSISKETAFLLTECLKDCAKNGTGKKLKEFSNVVACKTGTNGLSSSDKNVDAYCISYSTDYTICVWVGAKDFKEPLPQYINGGNQPTQISKLIWDFISPQKEFKRPNGIIEHKIDKIEYDMNDNVMLSSKEAKDRYIIKEYFNKKFSPKLVAQTFTEPTTIDFDINVQNREANISFKAEYFTNYELWKGNENSYQLLKTYDNEIGEITYIDKNLQEGIYEYFIISKKQKNEKKSIVKKIYVT